MSKKSNPVKNRKLLAELAKKELENPEAFQQSVGAMIKEAKQENGTLDKIIIQ